MKSANAMNCPVLFSHLGVNGLLVLSPVEEVTKPGLENVFQLTIRDCLLGLKNCIAKESLCKVKNVTLMHVLFGQNGVSGQFVQSLVVGVKGSNQENVSSLMELGVIKNCIAQVRLPWKRLAVKINVLNLGPGQNGHNAPSPVEVAREEETESVDCQMIDLTLIILVKLV